MAKSKFTLIIYPQDPDFVPQKEAVSKAKELLAEYFDAGIEEISTEEYVSPHFIGSGDSLEGFICPSCQNVFNRFDLEDEGDEEWWDDFLEKAEFAADATSVKIDMPCCENKVALTAIGFEGDVGFARFQLKLPDPGDNLEISGTQKSSLEQVLGCKLHQLIYVWS
jgi:hypothetical protein